MGSLELAIDTDMVAAEGAYSDDSYADGCGSHAIFLNQWK
jgi:hypothetical protein